MKRTVAICWASWMLLLGSSLWGCGDDDESPEQKQAEKTSQVNKHSATTSRSKEAVRTTHSEGKSDKAGRSQSHSQTLAKQSKSKNLEKKWKRRKEQISDAPFAVTISTAYLRGACAQGPAAERRKDTSGLFAHLEGEIVYNGSDILFKSELKGALVVHVGGPQYHEVPLQKGDERRPISFLPRRVRGADPWVPGQPRRFKVASLPLNEVFCEVIPKQVTLFVELVTEGIVQGSRTWPVLATVFPFDTVVGMALSQQIEVYNGAEKVLADAHYAKFDQILVTYLNGTTEWISLNDVVFGSGLKRSKGAIFPQEIVAGEWRLTVSKSSYQKEYDNFQLTGEDEFLALFDVDIENTSDEVAKLGELRMKLEVRPGVWKSPLEVGIGALGRSAEVLAGKNLEGTLVFPTQRFERPTRLRLEISRSGTAYMDVFSYEAGPNRSPLH